MFCACPKPRPCPRPPGPCIIPAAAPAPVPVAAARASSIACGFTSGPAAGAGVAGFPDSTNRRKRVIAAMSSADRRHKHRRHLALALVDHVGNVRVSTSPAHAPSSPASAQSQCPWHPCHGTARRSGQMGPVAPLRLSCDRPPPHAQRIQEQTPPVFEERQLGSIQTTCRSAQPRSWLCARAGNNRIAEVTRFRRGEHGD